MARAKKTSPTWLANNLPVASIRVLLDVARRPRQIPYDQWQETSRSLETQGLLEIVEGQEKTDFGSRRVGVWDLTPLGRKVAALCRKKKLL